jgi:hypothetical protein
MAMIDFYSAASPAYWSYESTLVRLEGMSMFGRPDSRHGKTMVDSVDASRYKVDS